MHQNRILKEDETRERTSFIKPFSCLDSCLKLSADDNGLNIKSTQDTKHCTFHVSMSRNNYNQ